MTDVLEDTYETARAGTIEYNTKSLPEAAKANTDAVFGFRQGLLCGQVSLRKPSNCRPRVRPRKQFETLTAQIKDLQETAKKVATDTAAPMKAAATEK